jgi:LemA protein
MFMNKVGIVLIAVVAILFLSFLTIYNGQISNDENANEAWGNVEASYQRRADLIPNLVETVKGYASHEKETLQAVTEARQQVTNIKAEIGDNVSLSPEMIQKFTAVQDQLSGALSRLLVTVEKYPDLKANQNFLDLQHQLEGTENRIVIARQRYNETVAELNKSVRSFFGRIVASMSGVEKREPFKSDEGAKNAPQVVF